jgi:hypothetical protein
MVINGHGKIVSALYPYRIPLQPSVTVAILQPHETWYPLPFSTDPWAGKSLYRVYHLNATQEQSRTTVQNWRSSRSTTV